jgi:hypothetical protein
MMSFKRFDHTCQSSRNMSISAAPMLAVNHRGLGVFNAAARQVLNGALYCALLYDKERGVVGIEPLREQQGRCFHLYRKNGSTTAAFGSFFRWINATPEKTTRYPLTLEGNLLIFRLNENKVGDGDDEQSTAAAVLPTAPR